MKVFYAVLAIHLLLLGMISFSREIAPPRRHLSLKVHCITLEAPQPPVAVEKITAKAAPPAPVAAKPLAPPQPKAPSKPKPKPSPKVVAKAPAKKPPTKTPPVKAAQTKQKKERLEQLTAHARASLAKIDEKPDKQSALTVVDEDYVTALVERLRLLLRLPAFGSVRIGLTLTREGEVVEVVVLQAHSDINRDYVVRTLQGQSFPSFKEAFPKEQQHNFTLTFANE
ncbi:MAG: hypothetical protein JSR80_07490 [Verrucomicrobia bacterium]|nr:hypothetical protein [Verrucomicrobiota bacterium]